MATHHHHKRYLFGLALVTAVMAVVMAVLLVFETTQRRDIAANLSSKSDSVTALTFQLEREFLRLRQTLDQSVYGTVPVDPDTLTLRYDIFYSRVVLLRDSPLLAVLANRQEYLELMPRLEALLHQADKVLGSPKPSIAQRKKLLQDFNQLGPQVQALSMASNSEVSLLLERHATESLAKSSLSIGLTVAMLLLLLMASAGLAWRQKRQEKELWLRSIKNQLSFISNNRLNS